MQYVNLGRSNLKVSRLGLGAMGIGDKSWRSWVLDEEASRPILKRALDLGRHRHAGLAAGQGLLLCRAYRTRPFRRRAEPLQPDLGEDERELLPFCRAEGLGLISYSPMARGYLTGRGRRAGTQPAERLRRDDYAQKIYGRTTTRRSPVKSTPSCGHRPVW